MHYSCVAISTVLVHDWMVDLYKTSYLSDDDGSCLLFPLHRRNVGQFLALYFICYQSWRLALVRNEPPAALYCEFYRQTFLCSVTIFNAAVGLYSNRPIIATSFCVAVGIDQLLWYVDLIVYFTWYVDFCRSSRSGIGFPI